MSDAICDLCCRPIATTPGAFCELRLCESCMRGNLEPALRALGIAIEAKQLHVMNPDGHETQKIRVTAELPGLHPRRADVGRMDLLGRVLNLLRPGASTGDALFDRNVRARSRDMRWLSRLLESEATQTAMLEISMRESASLRIRDACVHAECRGDDLNYADLGELTRAAGIILRRMAQLEDAWPPAGGGARPL